MSGERQTGDAAAGPGSALDPAELALARSRAYDLFGRLYLYGLTEAGWPAVQAIPELASAAREPFEPDEAAADHQHLFGFNVFPYQSIFLDPAVLLGGEVAEAVQHSYRAAGFDPGAAVSTGGENSGGENADHIGYELAFLAFLSGAEADAWQDGLPAVAGRMAGLQRRFLDQHLLCWLPPLVLAVEGQGQPFYGALARLTLALVQSHRRALGGDRPDTFDLPPAPALMADEATGLADIAAYLLTPASGGLYLSRDDLGRLALAMGLPRGFGERRQMLHNLLRAAAEYEGLEPLLGRLQSLANEWAAGYGAMAAGETLGQAAVWQARVAQTADLLDQMAHRVEGLNQSSPDGDMV